MDVIEIPLKELWFLWASIIIGILVILRLRTSLLDDFLESFEDLCRKIGEFPTFLIECIMHFFRNDTYLVTPPWKKKNIPNLADLVKAKRVMPKEEVEESPPVEVKETWKTPPEPVFQQSMEHRDPSLKSVSYPAVSQRKDQSLTGQTIKSKTEEKLFPSSQEHHDFKLMRAFINSLDTVVVIDIFNEIIKKTGSYPYWRGCSWGLMIGLKHTETRYPLDYLSYGPPPREWGEVLHIASIKELELLSQSPHSGHAMFLAGKVDEAIDTFGWQYNALAYTSERSAYFANSAYF